jgi:ketosteroid isomerase-like protein
MRTLSLLLLLAPTLSLAGAEQAVRCAEIAFSLSAERQDIEAFKSAIDPDARFVGEQALRGPEAIAAAWSPFFAEGGPRIAWRPRFVEVLASADYALSRGPFRLESQDQDGRVHVRWGTFNSVWRRASDGRWRVVFDAGGPPTESPPEEVRALLEAPLPDCPDLRPGIHTDDNPG